MSEVNTSAKSNPYDHLLIPPSTTFSNMVEWQDVNYREEEDKVFAEASAPPPAGDYMAWRAWEKASLALLPRIVLSKRYRPEVRVHSAELSIKYGDDNSTYSVCVLNPEIYPGESAGPRAALLMYHGGGWTNGTGALDHGRAEFLASELRAVVFTVDYRLCPEHRFPQNHNDCYHSIGWVIEHASEYNIDISRIALWGSSAGSHLAAGIALRDAVEHKPSRIRHLNLVVPVVCDTRQLPFPLSAKLENVPEEYRAQLTQIWEMLTGSTEPISNPYMSPLLADTPENHCPVHISVGGLDRLRDEGIAYAIHLRSHGIDTQLDVVPGVPHAFTTANKATACKQFWRDQSKVLNIALNPIW